MLEVDLYSAQATMEHVSHKERNIFGLAFCAENYTIKGTLNCNLAIRETYVKMALSLSLLILLGKLNFWVEFIPILQPLQSTVAMDR